MNKVVKIACWQRSCFQCREASHELRMLLGNSHLRPKQQHQHSTCQTQPCYPQTAISEKPSKVRIPITLFKLSLPETIGYRN